MTPEEAQKQKLEEDEIFAQRIGAINPEEERIYSITSNNIQSGYATAEGTYKYSQRNGSVHPDNFKQTVQGLTLGNLGYGSYLGDPSTAHDKMLYDAIITGVTSGGVNVIDTAPNYRYMKSERVIGAALKQLIQNEGISREELFLCSKTGYISEDADRPGYSQKMMNQLVDSGKLPTNEIIADTHCMHPSFMEMQLDQSLQNMQVDSLDTYYLHNSSESWMAMIGEDKYYDKLARSFEFMEEAVASGKIQSYGMATNHAFRSPPNEEGIYLSLAKVLDLARKVGGEQTHHFQHVQLPVSYMSVEAFWSDWQLVDTDLVIEDFREYSRLQGQEIPESKFRELLGDKKQAPVTVVKAARILRLNVIASKPLENGYLVQLEMAQEPFDYDYNVTKMLKFVQSIPRSSIVSILVGNKTQKHVAENLEFIGKPKVSEQDFINYLMSINNRVEEENRKEQENQE